MNGTRWWFPHEQIQRANQKCKRIQIYYCYYCINKWIIYVAIFFVFSIRLTKIKRSTIFYYDITITKNDLCVDCESNL